MMALNKSWRVRWQQRRGTRELQATPLEFWTFSCVCFRSPEGRRENSPGLQPWEGLRKESRPERAADFRAYSQKVTFVKSDSMAISEKKQRAQLGAKETGPSNVITTYLYVAGQSLFGRPREADLPECRWRKTPAWRAGGAFRAIPFVRSSQAWAVLFSAAADKNVQTAGAKSACGRTPRAPIEDSTHSGCANFETNKPPLKL